MALDDSYSKVLLHFNGTDASTTFTDESGKSWGAVADAQLDTADKKFGTASLLLDGTDDYIVTADHADFAFGTGDFTIDFWLKRATTTTAQMNILGQGASDLSGGYHLFKLATNTCNVTFQMNDETYNPSAGAITDNTTWHHVAVVRNGNNIGVSLDGAFGSWVDCTGATYTDCTGRFGVGCMGDFVVGTKFNGWIDEVRVSKGIARWTGNFTPPTGEYPVVVAVAVAGNHMTTNTKFW